MLLISSDDNVYDNFNKLVE